MYDTGPRATEPARATALDLDALIDRMTREPRDADMPPASLARVDRILAAVAPDGSREHVLAWTRELAEIFGAEVALLHVTPIPGVVPPVPAIGWVGIGVPTTFPPPDPLPAAMQAEELLAEAKRSLGPSVDATAITREGGAADGILRAARETAADLVIVGANEHGVLERLLLGTTTSHVLARARTNVLVARTAPTPSEVVAAVDGSAPSRQAAFLGHAIARGWGRASHLVFAGEGAPPAGDAVPGVTVEIAAGDPREVVAGAAARHRAGLVALGARGVGGLRAALMGSVGERLARTLPTNVLVARAPE